MEHWSTAECYVTGLIPRWAEAQGLKISEDEGTPCYDLQAVRPLFGLDDHVQLPVPKFKGSLGTSFSILI